MISLINGKTNILAVIGNPISHSASPKMHNHIIDLLTINYTYIPLLIQSESYLKNFFDFVRQGNIKGVNVTIPYKEAVIPFLDEIDPGAEQIAAVNTIVNESGKLVGYNTDGAGFIIQLNQRLSSSLKGKKVIMFGAGGSAKAISMSLLLTEISELIIVNRTESRAEKLKSKLYQVTDKVKIKKYAFNKILDKQGYQDLKTADIIINTTAIGLNSEASLLEDYSWISDKQLCCDIIYKPIETFFLKEAKKKGANILEGSGMLAAQGALAFKKFTQIDKDIAWLYQEMKKVVDVI
tara:strand:- start:1252 stop:2133 length:882 start_codon:yes stop_codon:yes gene_type:complete